MKVSPPLKEDIRLNIASDKISVPIYLRHNIFPKIKAIVPFDSYSQVCVLMDENINTYWGEKIRKVLGKNIVYIIIPAGAHNKQLTTVEGIIMSMLEKGLDRKSLLINIGGGVVCDMGGYAASIFMRGIPFINVPTTLLAQTDAAIGGKTGVDFGGLKNMVGSFVHPLLVISDTMFLSTLSARELRSGFAEVIKHALVYDKKFFAILDQKKIDTIVASILFHSCKIKCAIVSKDVNEKGVRKILNFGHTIGHAIEMVSQKTATPLLHGEAISIGMIAEARLSFLSGLITKKDFECVENIMLKNGLPSRVSRSYKKAIHAKMLGDKKNEKRKIKWVLLNGIGKAVYDKEGSEDLINKAIDYIVE